MKAISHILILITMSLSVNAQSWLDTSLYPFEGHYIELDAGKMHYVDEGEGKVILFVHGTPTWSFLYRDFIRDLSTDHRCLAIDHLGYGLSEKPDSFPGRPKDHAKNLSEFIRALDLKDITLVVHDFGGPIGLAAAIENSDRIKNVVLFNTWLWSTKENKEAQKVDRIVQSGFGRFLYRRMNVSPRNLLKMGFHDKRNLTRKVHQHYIKPFPDPASRDALLKTGRSLVGSSDWYEEQWNRLDSLNGKDWLILWGTKDRFISVPYLNRWKERFPKAKTQEFNCGHFVQEEETMASIAAIRKFIGA